VKAQVHISDRNYIWPHARRLLLLLVVNGIPLFLAFYGLKCILTLNGKLTEPSSTRMMGSFFLAPVHGEAALMTGFGNIFLAIFAFLSSGLWPSESRSIPYRIAREIIRWGSLAATFYFWHSAHKLRLGI
jgi:hypothetical protein